jgi:hypothetical protein
MLRQPLLDRDLRAGDGAGEDPRPHAAPRPWIARLARTPIYPLLFAAYPILALFAQNAREVPAADLVGVLAGAVVGAGAIWLVIGLLLKDAAKGALVTAVAILMFYTLRPVIDWSGTSLTYLSTFWVLRGRIKVAPIWPIVLEVLLLCGFALGIRRRSGPVEAASRFLNVLAVIAVSMPIVQIARIKAPTATLPTRAATPLGLLSAPASRRPPDIYYIILDGYARHDVMKSHFDFDNTAFLEHLESKGFYVARKSTANYGQTPLCLSAYLNATYLDELVKGMGTDLTALRDLIRQNEIVASLRPLGYRFVAFATGYDPTEQPEADRLLSPYQPTTEFWRMVVDMIPARAVSPEPALMDPFRHARMRITYLLDHLPGIARDSQPTFTFAHLICPHPPMIFGPNGEEVEHGQERFMLSHNKTRGRYREPEDFARAYRDQSIFITRRIQETIDRILAESPEPPIIIVQSDHGSELNLDLESVQNTDLHERMSILNAYYFPGGRYEGLYDSISPVNSFRVMLNTYFGAHLPLLPDRSYYSTSSDPFRFIDVTDAVRSGEASGPPGARAAGGRDPHAP